MPSSNTSRLLRADRVARTVPKLADDAWAPWRVYVIDP